MHKNSYKLFLSKESLLFLEKFLLWETKILSISIERCLSFNFGFPNDLGFLMIDLNLDVDVKSWNKEIIGSTDDCFLVFVGGKYIEMLDNVIEKVESIGKKLHTMARAIFINSQKGERRNIKETSPPLVSIFGSERSLRNLNVSVQKTFKGIELQESFKRATRELQYSFKNQGSFKRVP